MNLNQLKIFFTVANKKGFSLAANDLYLTQPGISIQVRLLEDSLGVQLIERNRRNIKLTDAGEVLFSFAKRIFDIAQEAETVIADYKTLRRGTLRIHTTRILAKFYLPEILNEFIKNYPSIKITLKAGNSLEAMSAVLNFESDIAVISNIAVRRRYYGKNLLAIPLFADKVVLVSSPKNILSKHNEIDPKELAGEPIIIRELGSGLRELTLEFFRREGISPHIIMELGNLDAIKKVMEYGVGSSFMTYSMVKEEVENGILGVINLSRTNLSSDYTMVYHKRRETSALIKTFVNQTLKMTPRLKKMNPNLS